MMKYLPQLTRIKNEAVFYLALLVGVAQWAIVEIGDIDFSTTESGGVFAIVAIILGLVQRTQAYGKETVDDIKAHQE